ncbi:MAG: DUF4258 domain-containing protein [Clostridia bacterium]|nr:DUF4258 domain-containing protein [Clostridia bacterium]
MDIELLKSYCNRDKIHWSVHASERIHHRGIVKEDVVNAINTGRIIEQYPDAFPFPACLIIGLNLRNDHMHIVCGFNGTNVHIITAYFPDTDKFEANFTIRRIR